MNGRAWKCRAAHQPRHKYRCFTTSGSRVMPTNMCVAALAPTAPPWSLPQVRGRHPQPKCKAAWRPSQVLVIVENKSSQVGYVRQPPTAWGARAFADRGGQEVAVEHLRPTRHPAGRRRESCNGRALMSPTRMGCALLRGGRAHACVRVVGGGRSLVARALRICPRPTGSLATVAKGQEGLGVRRPNHSERACSAAAATSHLMPGAFI